MNQTHTVFSEENVLHDLKHYLPAQAPLKDFIHHNTLHAFQNLKFEEALPKASKIFGYQVYLQLKEYRAHVKSGRIRAEILDKIIEDRHGKTHLEDWKKKLLNKKYDTTIHPRIGHLRSNWKKIYHLDLDFPVHPILFRVVCSYLDQGISIWNFPVQNKSFLEAIKEIEKDCKSSLFSTPRARKLLLHGHCKISDLLKIIVGKEELYEQYLFDQQFAHQGWSGMVAAVEAHPESLLERKNITLEEFIIFELLLEIDTLDSKFEENWSPLGLKKEEEHEDLFAPVIHKELNEIYTIFQEAYEWSYYDEVLAGLTIQHEVKEKSVHKTFQALFCIDDRECSIRRYLEKFDPYCETFGTPGFFGVEFYFKPNQAKYYTKLCPAPVNPKFLIKEVGNSNKRKKDAHFNKFAHSLFGGLLLTQTLGFWSAFRLFINVFKPSMSPATASSFRQMDKYSTLTFEHEHAHDIDGNLQVGFTVEEMATRVENLLRSIGLIKDFAGIVYVVGHGSSSVNNTYYAGYDCGACSGRPGSVNARVFCFMANHIEVRKILKSKGIEIPHNTVFTGALHDTTRDEIVFFDENALSPMPSENHFRNMNTFTKALEYNSKERARRFASIDTSLSARKIHNKIITRSVSLFEPRPEYNHATNALCIVGRRELTKHVFLDRRSFMNSYDYKIDPEGKLLVNVMKPLGPVCGGINLEYFFSRMDNQKLGAGTKLPHNVMGLFGVANGTDGDLRPGLPQQMIEIHDPVRLMIIVEHFPEVVLKTIKATPEMYEWFENNWVHLVAINPETNQCYEFKNDEFKLYTPLLKKVEVFDETEKILENEHDNLHVYQIK
jgi:uncharacterized protein YbcC (UPF0753/DUF2309 family)